MAELTWHGKYDANGKKNAPVRLALPFQDIETVNETAQVRATQLDLWSSGQPREWRNRLIWGDKKYVLPSLLPEFAGTIDLIYIDPPFNTGSDFSFTATIPDDPNTPGDQGATFTKAPSMIEQKAYRDTWGRGLDGYLHWFYETAVLLHELLSETGSLYVHLDQNVSHYAKAILDEVFNIVNFQNEIIWKRKDSNKAGTKMAVVTDSIFLYAKSDNQIWNETFVPYTEQRIDKAYNNFDQDGRKFALADLMAPGDRKGTKADYEWNGVRPRLGRHWSYTLEKMQELDRNGRIFWNSNGTPKLKMYLDESKGAPLGNLWVDIPMIKGGIEAVSYATQKPEALLERIIKASSNEGDLVLDCFCGSGTTAAVAEKLGRRWITCDLGRFAIHTTRKRLLNIANVTPFVVQNLGKYERQAWQTAEFGHDSARAALLQQRYRQFILELYHAEPLDGYAWLHGVKNGHFVHVGAVDAPIVKSDLQAIAREFWQAVGKNTGATVNTVDMLGWDFAFETNETGKQLLMDANIKAAFKKIPREVLERRAVEQGDIQFFELAALDVEVSTHRHKDNHVILNDAQRSEESQRTNDETLRSAQGDTAGAMNARVELRDFVVHPDDVPQDVMSKITHWSQWIDYWAVDWDYRGDTFHNEWQAYRTKQSPALQTSVAHSYGQPGSYTIVVKVIDILGNDTTKSMTVEVA